MRKRISLPFARPLEPAPNAARPDGDDRVASVVVWRWTTSKCWWIRLLFHRPNGKGTRSRRRFRTYLPELFSRCFILVVFSNEIRKQNDRLFSVVIVPCFRVRSAGFDVRKNRKNRACPWSAVSVCSSPVIITTTTPSRVRFSLFPPFGPYYAAAADDVINQRSRRQISFGPDPSHNVISSRNIHRVHVPITSLLFFR